MPVHHDGKAPVEPIQLNTANGRLISGKEKLYDATACHIPEDEVDIVNHPPHYTTGNIEVIDFIEDQKFGYHLGNVVKYLCRAPHKGDYLENLKKGKWYLDRLIEKTEKEKNDG